MQSLERDSKGMNGEEEEEEYDLWEGYKEQYKEALLPELEDGADNIW
jgi:hypothetical protein